MNNVTILLYLSDGNFLKIWHDFAELDDIVAEINLATMLSKVISVAATVASEIPGMPPITIHEWEAEKTPETNQSPAISRAN